MSQSLAAIDQHDWVHNCTWVPIHGTCCHDDELHCDCWHLLLLAHCAWEPIPHHRPQLQNVDWPFKIQRSVEVGEQCDSTKWGVSALCPRQRSNDVHMWRGNANAWSHWASMQDFFFLAKILCIYNNPVMTSGLDFLRHFLIKLWCNFLASYSFCGRSLMKNGLVSIGYFELVLKCMLEVQ